MKRFSPKPTAVLIKRHNPCEFSAFVYGKQRATSPSGLVLMTCSRHTPVMSFKYAHFCCMETQFGRHSGAYNGQICLDLPNIFISLAGTESLRKVCSDCTYTLQAWKLNTDLEMKFKGSDWVTDKRVWRERERETEIRVCNIIFFTSYFTCLHQSEGA